MISLLLLVTSQVILNVQAVNWQNGNWAFACDFKANDLSNAKVPADQCGPTCARTAGCTHFVWTSWQGGTCWMKTGSVSKSDAIDTGDQSMVCGVTGNNNTPINPSIE